jgi:hypothetical protein
MSNTRHALRNGDGGEATTAFECTVSNARHTLGEGDEGESAATTESNMSNLRHALWDGDGGEVTATKESIVANIRHPIHDPLMKERLGDKDFSRAFLVYTLLYRCLLLIGIERIAYAINISLKYHILSLFIANGKVTFCPSKKQARGGKVSEEFPINLPKFHKEFPNLPK